LEEARKKVQHYVSLIADRLPAHFYGLAPTTIAQAVIDRLKEQQATLSTCESFTGGSIASLITQVPGSSNAFNGGLVTYTNAIKQIVAGVSGETIQSFGAVSENTVKEMAENTRRKLGSDYALATSGVAGPETQEGKPVGHLYIALATPGKTEIFAYHMSGTRQQIIKRASKEALYLLWKHLKKGS
jgi:nicotinamide-nucleotide amidase